MSSPRRQVWSKVVEAYHTADLPTFQERLLTVGKDAQELRVLMLTVLNRHTPYFSRMANVGVGQLHWAASRSSSYDALCSEAAAEKDGKRAAARRASAMSDLADTIHRVLS